MNKKISLIIVFALLFAGMVSCKEDVNNTVKENEQVEVKVIMENEIGNVILTGSSTLAPVITKLTSEFSETNKDWNLVNEEFPKEDIVISINGGGSGAGAKSIIEGSANFGLVSRPVKDTEKEQITDYKEYKLGTDALTISVNPENKLYEVQDSLSTEELQKIFSGEYETWNQVNAELPEEEIVLVTRDIGGGAHGVFQKKIMGDLDVSESVIQAASMGALITKIIENKNAIGYASFGVVNQNKGNVIPMNVDGVEPTAENIISGDYIISRPLLVITGGEVSLQESKLIEFLLSERGMEVVTELGFVAEK